MNHSWKRFDSNKGFVDKSENYFCHKRAREEVNIQQIVNK